MKKINKIYAMFMTLLLTLSSLLTGATAFASQVTPSVTNTVTLHKILMSDTDLTGFTEGTTGLDKTNFKGSAIENLKGFFGNSAEEIAGVYFAVKNADGSKFVKEDGSETSDIAEALGGLTTKTGLVLNTARLKGDYQIVEVKEKTTYQGSKAEQLAKSKAVPVKITLPLVNESGIVADAHVYPKNTQDKPEIDKNFKDAGIDYTDNQRDKETRVQQVGDKVPYEVRTKIPAGSKYEKLVWTDSMSDGLTFNKDLKVSVAGVDLTEADYSVISDDNGFTLRFKVSGLDKIEAAATKGDVTIQLDYSATLNGKAVVEKPETNDVKLDYSNKPGKDSEPKTGQPKNGEIHVDKSWAIDGNEVTAADATVTATFTLQVQNTDGSWTDVDKVTVNSDAKFEHTFKNLDDNKTYRVVERVAGYEPEYVSMVDGVVTIKNTKDSTNPKTLNPSEPKVVTYGKKFVKTNDADAASATRLAGAQFVVQNDKGEFLAIKSDEAKAAQQQALTDAKKALDDAVAAYNGLSAEDQDGEKGTQAKALVAEKQTAYNEAFKANYTAYEWVASKEATNVVKLFSNKDGQFEITGLKDGDYKLVETVAPTGYATLNGPVLFTVTATSYSATNQDIAYKTESGAPTDATQIRNKKVSIPQTGGIGTIVFAVAGAILMGVAAVAYYKNNKEEQA